MGLWLSPLAIQADVPLLYVNRKSLLPGQTMKIQFPTRSSQTPSLTWKTTVYPFIQTPDHFWRVLVPVPMSQGPGKETLYIAVNNSMPSDFIDGPLDIEIISSRYGKEDLIFSDEKAKLLNDPAEESESELIREMIKASRPDLKQKWKGIFVAPIPGKVLSPFGRTRNKKGQKAEDWHKGVDLAGRSGDPVVAPNAGVVLLVKEFNFHGKTVLISHGQGIATIYIHLKSFAVKEGESVKKGQKIGEVGATGLATGPHLHWGLYVQGQPVDPLQWLEEEF